MQSVVQIQGTGKGNDGGEQEYRTIQTSRASMPR